MRVWDRFIHPVTGYFRRRRGRFLLSRVPDLAQCKICDLGGSRHFWEKLDFALPPSNITIFNISDDETEAKSSSRQEGEIEIVIYDGEHIPAEDKAFDICISNSVLEHVPPAARAALAKEMQRVAHRVFCQTPAYEFPIEPHFIMPFIHWLPRPIGYFFAKFSVWRLLSRPSPSTIDNYWRETRLLDRAEVASLFPNADVIAERFLGLTKSYYVVQ